MVYPPNNNIKPSRCLSQDVDLDADMPMDIDETQMAMVLKAHQAVADRRKAEQERVVREEVCHSSDAWEGHSWHLIWEGKMSRCCCFVVVFCGLCRFFPIFFAFCLSLKPKKNISLSAYIIIL